MTSLVDRLLPDALWQRIQPLLPAPPPRSRGGVPRRVPDRNCVAALIFMARTSTPWSLFRAKELGCGSATTCWRRLDAWARAGVFDQLQAMLLDELGAAGRIDLERVSVDSFSVRAVKGGPDRRMIEPSDRLGRYRWTIERTGAWLGGWRRLRIRYERSAERFYALVRLACSVICFNALTSRHDGSLGTVVRASVGW
jgi:transposase